MSDFPVAPHFLETRLLTCSKIRKRNQAERLINGGRCGLESLEKSNVHIIEAASHGPQSLEDRIGGSSRVWVLPSGYQCSLSRGSPMRAHPRGPGSLDPLWS